MFNNECYCAQYNGPELSLSTSGGVFFAFAKYIIEHGGCAFGAAFSPFPHLRHICVESVDNLYKIQGSKYVESDFVQSLPELKKRVEIGQKVLFSGTPCQIAALRAYLKADFQNLLTMDIVCHGTPNKKIFQEYVKWREKKWNTKLDNYEFRNKKVSPWGGAQKGLLSTSNGYKVIPSECDPYFCAFQKGLIAQKKCYSCRYASSIRMGDITAADFWSAKIYFPDFPYKNGVSSLLINTQKGKEYFKKVKTNFILEEASFEKACKWKPHLKYPLSFNPVQQIIYDTINNGGGFDSVLHLIPTLSYPEYVKRKVVCWAKQQIKKVLDFISRSRASNTP